MSKVKNGNGEEKDFNLSHTSLNDLAKKLKVPFQEVYNYHHAMKQLNQVQYIQLGGKHYLRLEEDGHTAMIEEYWLREGERELNERIYDKTKWLVPVIVLILTIGSIIYSANKAQAALQQVHALQLEVERLQSKIN